MLLYKVCVHITVELGEPHTVRVAVAGGVAENGGVFVQLIPAADFVFTMGIPAAPHGILTVFIQLQVIAVVLRLHHGVVHLRAGNIQPRHGVGILRSGFRQLCLPVHRGDNFACGSR